MRRNLARNEMDRVERNHTRWNAAEGNRRRVLNYAFLCIFLLKITLTKMIIKFCNSFAKVLHILNTQQNAFTIFFDACAKLKKPPRERFF
jgi:hypothetical protein